MDNIKTVARAAVILVALVFAVAVAGASADGVRGDIDTGAWTHFSTFQTSFNSNVNTTWKFDKNFDWDGGFSGFGSFDRYDGLREGYWLKGEDFTAGNNSWYSPDPTASPEPGTVLLLVVGMAGLFFMGRRKAFQE